MSTERLAHLESILTQNENEIDFLETTLRKIRKEYHDNKQELTLKIKEIELRDAEIADLKKVSAQRDHEFEALRSRNEKIEGKVKSILASESGKIGQTLTQNQKLEEENLKLFSLKVGLEEKVREAALQINHYKNLNEAHEKHQILSRKNIVKLEEQLEKLTNELTELRKQSLAEINAKKEENTVLTFRLEESASNVEVLRKQLEHKQELIKKLENNSLLKELEKKLRATETAERTRQRELEEKKCELKALQELHKTENDANLQQMEEYEQLVSELREKLDVANASLADAQLENKKIKFESEHEKSVREHIENFRIPLFHRDRLTELNNKIVEHEKRYQKIVEENKRLVNEVAKAKSDMELKLAEYTRTYQEGNKEDFSAAISKFQQALETNRMILDENNNLQKDLEFKSIEIQELQKEVESFSSKNRALVLENSKLKIELHRYNPTLNLDLVSRKELDETMERERREYQEKLREMKNQLEASRNKIGVKEFNELKTINQALKSDIDEKNELIGSLLNQLKALKQASMVSNMISVGASSSGNMAQRQKSIGYKMEETSNYEKQITELVQKTFELEDAAQRSNQENAMLIEENQAFSKKVTELKLELRTVDNQKTEYLQRINILEKEKQINIEAIGNRERHISELARERNKVLEEKSALIIRVNELEETKEKLVEKVRYFEEYTNKMSQINSNIIGDKEAYLMNIINHKNEIALLEKRYQGDIAKLIKEREELKEQLIKVASEREELIRENDNTKLSTGLKLENQNVIIANYLKKTAHLEKVIAELDAKVNEYLVASQKDLEKSIPKLSEISNILNRSRLTVEDYKNFEAIKELLGQQKTQYEDSVKFLENTIETLSQKYLNLEENYLNEKAALGEQLDKLRRENFEIINKYENKLKEQEESHKAAEERSRKLREKLQSRTQQQQQQYESEEAGGMEVEEQGGAEGGEEAGEEGEVREPNVEVDVESLKAELNSEKEARLNLESELEKEKEIIHKIEEEKVRLLRLNRDLENQKLSLSKIFTLREVSWMEQKKNYVNQMEEFRTSEKERTKQLNDLMDKVENVQGQGEVQEGSVVPESDQRHQDLLVQIENLRSDNLTLKRALEEKRRELVFRGQDLGLDGDEVDLEEQKAWKQKYEVLESEYKNLKQAQIEYEEEKNRLKGELADMNLKIGLLEAPGGEAEDKGQENMVVEGEEKRDLVDDRTLVETLERAQNIILALGKKKI